MYISTFNHIIVIVNIFLFFILSLLDAQIDFIIITIGLNSIPLLDHNIKQ